MCRTLVDMPGPTDRDHCPTRAEFRQGRPRTPLHLVATSVDDRHLSVVADGEIDADSAHLLQMPLAGIGYESVEFDCRAVDFMGVAGVDELLALAVRYDLGVVASRPVRRVIELCGVSELLSLVTPPDARQHTQAATGQDTSRWDVAS